MPQLAPLLTKVRAENQRHRPPRAVIQQPQLQYIQETYETLHHCATLYHIGEPIVCSISDCVLMCRNQAQMLSESAQDNEAFDLHEPSCSSWTTTKCTIPAKLLTNGPSYILSEKRWYATAVIGGLISPNSLIFALLTLSKINCEENLGNFSAWSDPSAALIEIIGISKGLESINDI